MKREKTEIQKKSLLFRVVGKNLFSGGRNTTFPVLFMVSGLIPIFLRSTPSVESDTTLLKLRWFYFSKLFRWHKFAWKFEFWQTFIASPPPPLIYSQQLEKTLLRPWTGLVYGFPPESTAVNCGKLELLLGTLVIRPQFSSIGMFRSVLIPTTQNWQETNFPSEDNRIFPLKTKSLTFWPLSCKISQIRTQRCMCVLCGLVWCGVCVGWGALIARRVFDCVFSFR